MIPEKNDDENEKKEMKPEEIPNEIKKKGLFSKRKEKKTRDEIKTVVHVKTIGDIPPIVEARKDIGENNVRRAVIRGYLATKDDYIKFFGVKSQTNEGERAFIIRTLDSVGIKIPEEGYVDGKLIKGIIETVNLENQLPKASALIKLASFMVNYYEVARYSDQNITDGENVLKMITEIYNYMDITKLYFPDGEGE